MYKALVWPEKLIKEQYMKPLSLLSVFDVLPLC